MHNNTISQPGQVAFAGLMLDNFNAGMSTGVRGIHRRAGQRQHDRLLGGPQLPLRDPAGRPSLAPVHNILAGDVHGNTVTSARQGINVEGAGTAAAPLLLYGNTVTNAAPGSARFNCGVHSTSDFNINTTDSVVNRNGDTSPITTFVWHGCP